ncbi:hypothetical protein RF11_13170 [Thelohanellus kitauei]|uniref:Uncharacterized protein n=1 Tax=Thelohanellus kitauei TaxID=669202 RepID=A0A0C2JNG7_THEKT|nr:hypothetical protein RF11_13170 [Thelohanellus kitauei]
MNFGKKCNVDSDSHVFSKDLMSKKLFTELEKSTFCCLGSEIVAVAELDRNLLGGQTLFGKARIAQKKANESRFALLILIFDERIDISETRVPHFSNRNLKKLADEFEFLSFPITTDFIKEPCTLQLKLIDLQSDYHERKISIWKC